MSRETMRAGQIPGNKKILDAVGPSTSMVAEVVMAIPRNYTGRIFGERGGSTAAAAQFPALACDSVRIKARYNNGGRVYISDSSAITLPDGTSDFTSGWELSAGEETPEWACTNLNDFWLLCDTTAGDDVSFVAMTS